MLTLPLKTIGTVEFTSNFFRLRWVNEANWLYCLRNKYVHFVCFSGLNVEISPGFFFSFQLSSKDKLTWRNQTVASSMAIPLPVVPDWSRITVQFICRFEIESDDWPACPQIRTPERAKMRATDAIAQRKNWRKNISANSTVCGEVGWETVGLIEFK